MADQVDYTALAKQAGAVSSQPAAGGAIDYAALAKQAGAVSSDPPPDAKSVGGFLQNAASSAGNFVGDVAGAVAHPLRTVEGLTGLLEGMAEKSGFKPVAGQSHAQNVDALMQMYKDRYGSIENLKNSLYKDPVGVLADVATLASGFGAAGKGVELAADAAKLPKVAAVAGTVARGADAVSGVTDPLRLAGKAADATGVTALAGKGADAVSRGLTRGALRGGYNIGTMDPAVLDEAVKTMNERGIPFSKEGLDSISQSLRDIQQQKLKLTGAGRPIDPAAVELRLDDVANQLGIQGNPDPDLKQLEAVRMNWRKNNGGAAMTDAKGRPLRDQWGNKLYSPATTPIPADQAEALKEGTYANNDYSKFPESKTATAKSEQGLARGLKEELERQMPELTSLNDQQRKLIGLDGILDAAVSKYLNKGGFWPNIAEQTVSSVKGAGKSAALTGMGAMFHEPAVGASLAVMQGVLSDPVVKQRLAVALREAQLANPGKYGAPSMATALSRVNEYTKRLQPDSQ